MRTRRSVWGWIGALLVAATTLAFVAVAVAAVLPLVRQSLTAINFPYALNYGEGPLLDQSLRLSRGEALYTLDVPPYTIENYPPVYMALQAPWVSAYGASYFYGRITTIASTALAALFLGLTAHALTKQIAAGLVAAGLLLATPYVFLWSALARVDLTALAFSLAGLFVAVRFPRHPAGAVGAAVLLVLAVYTRQTALLAAPLAAFIYRWRVGGAEAGWTFAVVFGGLVLGLFALLLIFTQGGIWFHLITANVNALSDNAIRLYADEIARTMPLLLGMALIFIVFGWPDRRTRAAWFAVTPYVLAGIISALTIAKVGSDVNYLLEFCAGLCVATGAFVAWAGRFPALQALSIAALAGQIAVMQDLSLTKYAPIIRERFDQQAALDSVYQLMRDETRPILADDAMGMLPLLGRPILFQPFEMTQLALDGVWDERAFIADLERGAYPVILIQNPYRNPSVRFERWTPAMLAVINEHYRVATQRAENTVYWFDAG